MLSTQRLRRARDRALAALTSRRGVEVAHPGGPYRVTYETRTAFSAGYEWAAMTKVREALQPGGSAWSIGANVGQWALPMARLVGRDGWVLAVEPNAEAANLLERNLALNGLHATTLRCAAGRERGEVDFHATGFDPMSRPGQRNPQLAASEVCRVQVVPLDEMLQEARAPDVVVIDVEGFEVDALEGAPRVLALAPLVVCEFHPNAWAWCGRTPAEMATVLDRSGLRALPLSGQVDALADHGQVMLTNASATSRPA